MPQDGYSIGPQPHHSPTKTVLSWFEIRCVTSACLASTVNVFEGLFTAETRRSQIALRRALRHSPRTRSVWIECRGLLFLSRCLLRFLHQPGELMQLDTVQIGYGPIVHA